MGEAIMPDPLRSLDLVHPIFQAPIGGVASAELAAAVSNAGGLGHLACTWRNPDQLKALFATMGKLTHKPYGANFVLDFPIEDQLAVALDCGVGAISFFWGDGARYVSRVKAAGAIAIQIIGSIADAKRAADAGFDLVVAQGREAGGHVRGEMGTMTLVPQVVDILGELPVLAGGGIVDRRGVAAAMALGARGVWVGTRFLAATEANIHPLYRQLVLTSNGDNTLYSELFDIGWPNAPLRTLKNATTRNWEAAGRPATPHRPGEGEHVARRPDGSEIPRYFFGSPTRDTTGDAEAMALYAGEGVGLVHAEQPAAAIVSELATGLNVASDIAAVRKSNVRSV
jgi:nitronate monooxygenase